LDKKKIYIVLATFIVVMLVIEIMFAHPHHHMIWNTMPGADILLGFAGAWLLIFIAKIVMANFLQRKEGYYENGGEDK